MLRILITLAKIKIKMIKKSRKRKLKVMTWKLILELLEELQEKNRKFKRKIRQKQDEINLLEYKEIKDINETINSLIEEILNEKLNNIEEIEPESKDLTEVESEEDDD